MVNCGGKHDKGNDIPMKIWNKTHHLTDTNLILNETFTEDAFFFDIETTGFSPAYTFLYLIGCAHRVGDDFIITQYFAEAKEEEGAIHHIHTAPYRIQSDSDPKYAWHLSL